jgi:hypothetical protein
MSTFFGAEVPTPFCVVTEQYLKESVPNIFHDAKKRHDSIPKNVFESNELESNYEEELYSILNKYLDINCDDDILILVPMENDDLMGNYESNWSKIIEKKYVLTKSVTIGTVKKVNNSRLFNRVGKDLNFYKYNFEINEEPNFECDLINCSNKSKKFDKILVKNCMKYFDSNPKYFCEYIMTLFKQQQKQIQQQAHQKETNLLIIQRNSEMSTLPFYTNIKQEWKLTDANYKKFIETMQNYYFSIKSDLENLKLLIDCKSTWFANIKEKTMYPLSNKLLITNDDQKDFIKGIRELNEGSFKYQQMNKFIEMNDCLLVIGACQEQKRHKILTDRIRNRKEKVYYSIEKDYEIENEIQQLNKKINPLIQTNFKTFNKFNKLNNDFVELVQFRKLNR